MKAEIIVTQDGKVLVLVPNGEAASFEIARSKIAAKMAELGQAIPEMVLTSEPERHTHGPDTHVHTKVEAS